jgi:hypothetical protein
LWTQTAYDAFRYRLTYAPVPKEAVSYMTSRGSQPCDLDVLRVRWPGMGPDDMSSIERFNRLGDEDVIRFAVKRLRASYDTPAALADAAWMDSPVDLRPLRRALRSVRAATARERALVRSARPCRTSRPARGSC